MNKKETETHYRLQLDLCHDALRRPGTTGRMCRDAMHTVGQYGNKTPGGMNRLHDAVDMLADSCAVAWAELAADPAREPHAMPALQGAACGVAYEMALVAQSASWFLAEDVLNRAHSRGALTKALPIDSPLHRIIENRYKQVPSAVRVQKAVYELLYAASKPGIGEEIYFNTLETVMTCGVIVSAAYAAAVAEDEEQ